MRTQHAITKWMKLTYLHPMNGAKVRALDDASSHILRNRFLGALSPTYRQHVKRSTLLTLYGGRKDSYMHASLAGRVGHLFEIVGRTQTRGGVYHCISRDASVLQTGSDDILGARRRGPWAIG